ncbi:hypothetical protein WQO_27990 [Streptomyces globisporus C-1027]|uniref:Uncharacterized protein n=1 Tax=Streptomyces globisporus C-1027 TaxID=1172567 RepID=A0A0U3BIT8_STRGL|nr:hypothetical protein WQO_27990 [Streptomyces globisporus C-1027]
MEEGKVEYGNVGGVAGRTVLQDVAGAGRPSHGACLPARGRQVEQGHGLLGNQHRGPVLQFVPGPVGEAAHQIARRGLRGKPVIGEDGLDVGGAAVVGPVQRGGRQQRAVSALGVGT